MMVKFDSLKISDYQKFNSHPMAVDGLNEAAQSIVKFMRVVWELRTPGLIISVTGGAKYLETPMKIREVFKRDLIAAAITTDAWIFTGGTNSGVMKEVGDARRRKKYENISTDKTDNQADLNNNHTHFLLLDDGRGDNGTEWKVIYGGNPENVKERSDLTLDLRAEIEQESTGHLIPDKIKEETETVAKNLEELYSQSTNWSINQQTTYLGNIITKLEDIKHRTQETLMESQHITSVREALRQIEVTIKNSVELNNFLNKRKSLQRNSESLNEINKKFCAKAEQLKDNGNELERVFRDVKIPVVQILIDGGPSTVLTFCKAVERFTPVIVINRTGRAADCIAKLHGILYGTEQDRSKDVYEKATKNETRLNDYKTTREDPRYKDIIKKDTNEEIFDRVMKSREGYFLINIFEFDNQTTSQLNNAILQALINAEVFHREKTGNKDRKMQIRELKLSMAWENIQRARTQILTDKTNFTWKKHELDECLAEALYRGSFDFIQLLLEFGASFEQLTNYVSEDTLYGAMLKNSPIVASLFASKIYYTASRIHGLSVERVNEFKEKAKQWAQHASAMIDLCFDDEEQFALKLLDVQSKQFFNSKILDLAEEIDSRPFLATRTVQNYVDNECFVLLVDYFPLNKNGGRRSGHDIPIPITEIILHICMASLIIEEIRQIYSHRKYYRTKNYFTNDLWNILDTFAFAFYVIGLVTRCFIDQRVFTVSKQLGPKLLLIFNTLKDIVFFGYFILIFLFAYMITAFSLITTDDQVTWIKTINGTYDFELKNNGSNLLSWQIVRNIIDWGIWKVYGEVDLHIEMDGSNLTQIRAGNDAYGTTALFLTIFFVTVANVLLLNVLVALFNRTIEKVNEQAHQSSCYYRFLLVKEYRHKPLLPPPFNIISMIYSLCKKDTLVRTQWWTDEDSDRLQQIYEDVQREMYLVEDYWRKVVSEVKNTKL
ncbi:unnamed protein product [Didymodactylos carnosus]|uniref:Uncharacterized protein n=1 Tax=Didymodactylos carnosus TaxID=1234261 RepID=A0A8S2CRH2_9BILA|nr:unnamed protein product [Didymodactylos carnosus]CAF3565092.1 unnamed protein product [Didymodactylos carnosus]